MTLANQQLQYSKHASQFMSTQGGTARYNLINFCTLLPLFNHHRRATGGWSCESSIPEFARNKASLPAIATHISPHQWEREAGPTLLRLRTMATNITREEVLRLKPSGDKDELGGYVQRTLAASYGYTVATYEWEPACGFAAAKAVVFAMHGILGHTAFEWLAPNADNHRVLLKGSVFDKLLGLGVAVIAHDHPGHGRTSGLHGYVDSHDHLRDVGIDVIEHFKSREDLKGKPAFLMGMSMGGSTSIRVCAKSPDLLDGVALFSPAVRPPDDMFGPYGHFLKFISPVLGFLVPKLPVLKLPPSPDPTIRDAVEKDGLLYRGALRVQMAMEFLRVYSEINDNADKLTFTRVAIFIGQQDTIVSPSGIKSFVERIKSEDKHVYMYENLGHEVLREAGCEKAVEQFVQWVKERVNV